MIAIPAAVMIQIPVTAAEQAGKQCPSTAAPDTKKDAPPDCREKEKPETRYHMDICLRQSSEVSYQAHLCNLQLYRTGLTDAVQLPFLMYGYILH